MTSRLSFNRRALMLGAAALALSVSQVEAGVWLRVQPAAGGSMPATAAATVPALIQQPVFNGAPVYYHPAVFVTKLNSGRSGATYSLSAPARPGSAGGVHSDGFAVAADGTVSLVQDTLCLDLACGNTRTFSVIETAGGVAQTTVLTVTLDTTHAYQWNGRDATNATMADYTLVPISIPAPGFAGVDYPTCRTSTNPLKSPVVPDANGYPSIATEIANCVAFYTGGGGYNPTTHTGNPGLLTTKSGWTSVQTITDYDFRGLNIRMGSGELIFSQCLFDASVYAPSMALTTLSAGSCNISTNNKRIFPRTGQTFSSAWVGQQIAPVIPDGDVGPLNITTVAAVASDGSYLDLNRACTVTAAMTAAGVTSFNLAFTVSPNPILNPIVWAPIALSSGDYSTPLPGSPRVSMNYCDIYAGLPAGYGYGVQAASWIGLSGCAGNPTDGADRGIRFCRIWDSVNDPNDCLNGLYERCYSRGGGMGKGGHVDGIQPAGVYGAGANPLIIRNNYIDNRKRRIDSLANVMGGVLTDALGNNVIGVNAPTSGINGGVFYDSNDSVYSDTSASAYGNIVRGGTYTLVVKNLQQGVTFTQANPTVVSYGPGSAHHLQVGDRVIFKLSTTANTNTITGSMPTGLTAYRIYWVVVVPSTSTFQISATQGGTAIDLSGASTLGSGIIMSAPVKALQAYYSNLVAEGVGGPISFDAFRNGPRWVTSYGNVGTFTQAADSGNANPASGPITSPAFSTPSNSTIAIDFNATGNGARPSIDNDGQAVGTPSAAQTNPYGYEYQVQPSGTALSASGWLPVPYGAVGQTPGNASLTRVTLSALSPTTAYNIGLRTVSAYSDPGCISLQWGTAATTAITMPS